MPLQNTRAPKTGENQLRTSTSPGTPAGVPASPPSSLPAVNEPRFDVATVERVLVLAGQTQAQHQQTQAQTPQTLSQPEIEVMGRELGIEPVFISRAVEQVRADQQAKAAKALARKANRITYGKLRTLVADPLRAPFWSFVAMSVTMPWIFTPTPATNGLYFLLPILTAFAVAIKFRGNRDAGDHQIGVCVWQGFGFGAAGLAAFFVTALVHHMDPPDTVSLFIVLMAWLGSGAFAAVVGAAIRSGFNYLWEAKEP